MAIRWQAGMGETTQRRLVRLKDPATRRRERRFMVEGRKAVEAMIAGGAVVDRLVVLEGVNWQPGELPDAVTVHVTPSVVMSRLATLSHRPELLGVFREPVNGFPFAPWPDRLLVVYGVQDPGNLGTLLRSAAAFGVGHVVLLKGCTDPYAPKVTRATAGLLPHLSLAWEVPPAAFFEAAAKNGTAVLALAPEGEKPLRPTPGKAALLLGAEGQGLKGVNLENSTVVRLPGVNPALPLNVAMAATLGLYVLWGQKE